MNKSVNICIVSNKGCNFYEFKEVADENTGKAQALIYMGLLR